MVLFKIFYSSIYFILIFFLIFRTSTMYQMGSLQGSSLMGWCMVLCTELTTTIREKWWFMAGQLISWKRRWITLKKWVTLSPQNLSNTLSIYPCRAVSIIREDWCLAQHLSLNWEPTLKLEAGLGSIWVGKTAYSVPVNCACWWKKLCKQTPQRIKSLSSSASPVPKPPGFGKGF